MPGSSRSLAFGMHIGRTIDAKMKLYWRASQSCCKNVRLSCFYFFENDETFIEQVALVRFEDLTIYAFLNGRRMYCLHIVLYFPPPPSSTGMLTNVPLLSNVSNVGGRVS